MTAAIATMFPTVAKVKRKTDIDTDYLAVEHNVPPPKKRAFPAGKYHKQFALMQPGSCIRCEASEVGAISMALRKQIQSGKYPKLAGCSVRSSANCDDGHARVWAIQL